MISMPQEQEEFNTQQIPQSIIAQIISHLDQPYQLSSQMTLDLSTLTDELMLNDMIKKLLLDEKSEEEYEEKSIENMLNSISFDFLVAQKLLRGNLKSHLIRYNISPETVIKIQYFIAFQNLEKSDKFEINDWVSCLQLIDTLTDHKNNENKSLIIGLYNGCIELERSKTNTKQKNKNSQYQIHSDPIKSLKVMLSPIENLYYLITGGLSEELKVTTLFDNKKQGKKEINIEAKNQHEGSILTIDTNPILDGHFCTAGSEGSLNIWKIAQTFMEESPQVKTKNKKRKQTNLKKADFITSQHFSQNDSILTSKWATTSQIILGCSDHSIKLVDVEKMSAQRFFLTKDSVTTSLDYSSTRNILLSSHEDGYLRSWDLRSSNTSPASTFKAHTKYISSVEFNPNSSNIFASGAYDSIVNIWDIRSVFPLQSLNTNYDKILALKWKSEQCLIVGGSSPQVTYFQV